MQQYCHFSFYIKVNIEESYAILNFNKSHLWSNSFPVSRSTPIDTKFAQHIEATHTQGNVQQYSGNIATEPSNPISKQMRNRAYLTPVFINLSGSCRHIVTSSSTCLFLHRHSLDKFLTSNFRNLSVPNT